MSQGSTGRHDFAVRHGLTDAARDEAAARVATEIASRGLEVVRISFPDQHGLLRGKTLMASEAAAAFRNGCAMTSTLLLKDTAHRTVYPAFSAGGGIGMQQLEGAADIIMLPDPTTFRVLPWAPGTGWLLADIHFADGTAIPFASRDLLRRQLARLDDRGWDAIAGVEIEFHLFRRLDDRLAPADATQPASPPEVELLAHGYHYLTELRQDELEPALAPIRRDLAGLGLPLRSFEIEFGPSQVEITLAPGPFLAVADDAVLLRSAIKQIARRQGLHASFMCRPALPNLLSSGWHVHQSLIARSDGRNLFQPDDGAVLSPTAGGYLGGLLRHAAAASVFSTPTINGYKRYRPFSLAPDRINWGHDNKGTMLRLLGGAGDPGSRIENRVGEPAANPYLHLTAQLAAGLDGIDRGLDPGPPADAPYETPAPMLPDSLMTALAALRDSEFFAAAFGPEVIAYFATLKQAEIDRFLASVTDWEQREYFEMY